MKLKYDSFTKEAQCRNLKQFISRFHREKLQFILDVMMMNPPHRRTLASNTDPACA